MLYQRIDVTNELSRSIARERAAESAYRFVVRNGLWINLKDELARALEISPKALRGPEDEGYSPEAVMRILFEILRILPSMFISFASESARSVIPKAGQAGTGERSGGDRTAGKDPESAV